MKVKAWQFESEYHKVMTSFVQVFDSVNNPWFQFFEILKSKNCWFWCFERKNQNWIATGSGCFRHWKNLWFLWKNWQRTIGFWVVLSSSSSSSSLRMMVIYEDWFFVFFRTVVLISRTSLIISGGLVPVLLLAQHCLWLHLVLCYLQSVKNGGDFSSIL